MYFNIDKSLSQLTENRIYQGVSSQQYTVTAANSLADMLSNILDNMQMSMNMKFGSGEGEMQLPDIIMSQEELNKQMEEAMKKLEVGKRPGDGEEGEQGKKGDNGNQGENGKDGKGSEGKNGKDGKNGKEGNEDGEGEKNDGYGEGGSEEFNGELYKIYQQQQKLRQALQDKIGKEGSKGNAGDLIRQMEEVGLDLINKGFTNQTLQKMKDLQHQLLKIENATFTQGEDEKRASKTNRKEHNKTTNSQIPTAKQYFKTTEILKRQALPLRSQFKKKLQDYFKNTND